jgi:hypothetical protein
MSDAFRIRLENLERRIDALEAWCAALEAPDDPNFAVKRYSAQHKGHGKFVVMNSNGRQATDELLSREDALFVAEQLNALP